MMNNLFSIFDPSSALSLSMNWISLVAFSMMLVPSFWLLSNSFKAIFKTILLNLVAEFSLLLKAKKINMIVFIALFSLILLNNTLGLMSFTFTATSHLAITLSLALPLWVGFMIFSLLTNLQHFLAHLVPLGTPTVLMPFMVIIEIISSVIRPITLSVRLAANMIAGHLLMTLLGNLIVNQTWTLFPSLMLTQCMLSTLESAVACIQAYVFSVLTTLYASEA